MAEAIAREMGHEASSAGTHPPENQGISENAKEVLTEIGIDTSELFPKPVDYVGLEDVDMIISMGCGVNCPTLPIDQDWGLEDPHGSDIGAFRKTREEIRERLSRLSMKNTDA